MSFGLSYDDCYKCGKRAYPTRAVARLAIKRLHPHEHKQPYRCPHETGWHIGGLDKRVARGEISKQERYAA